MYSNDETPFSVYISIDDITIFNMTSAKILNNLKNNHSQYFILFFYVFKMTVIIMDNNEKTKKQAVKRRSFCFVQDLSTNIKKTLKSSWIIRAYRTLLSLLNSVEFSRSFVFFALTSFARFTRSLYRKSAVQGDMDV